MISTISDACHMESSWPSISRLCELSQGGSMLCDEADSLELTRKHVCIKLLAWKLFWERVRLL